MNKTSSLNLFAPFISSHTTGKNISAISWRATKEVPNRVATSSAWVPKVAVLGVVMLGAMIALHLYWVNTYSDKGFALSEVQDSIKEQTDLQKKLLVQQSMLNSTAGLTDSSENSLVSITDEEYLAPSNLAAAQ